MLVKADDVGLKISQIGKFAITRLFGTAIDRGAMRILTMASKARQKEWLKLHKSEDTYAPVGEQLKRWLFGGDIIRTSAALFDLAEYDGEIVTDLFGEESYFADSNAFWQMQEEAIEARK